MCSTPVQRIAEIGPAIDDQAAHARTAYRPAARGDASAASDAGAAADADQVLIRLAALWGKLAELDPEVAKRLPTYDA